MVIGRVESCGEHTLTLSLARHNTEIEMVPGGYVYSRVVLDLRLAHERGPRPEIRRPEKALRSEARRGQLGRALKSGESVLAKVDLVKVVPAQEEYAIVSTLQTMDLKVWKFEGMK